MSGCEAWVALVRAHAKTVWTQARKYSLTNADAEDAYQSTWVKLAEHLQTIRDPAALPQWLATTARREALRMTTRRKREYPSGVDSAMWDKADSDDSVENRALRSVFAGRLAQAMQELSGRCQQLLRLVALDTSYAQLGAALGVKKGTIGPARGRCLAALRNRLAAVGAL